MTSSAREHSLEELKKLAKPALADARLVDLSRDGSVAVKRVVSVAEGLGVSRRQSRAVRWLAIIRRDFGIETLQEFVSSMARARTEQSVTEHAHLENQAMSTERERVLKSLELIRDPHKRFELMLNKGMKDEALAYLTELVETKTAFFWLNEAGGGIARPLLRDNSKSASNEPLHKVVLVCHDDPEFCVRQHMELQISVTGLWEFFGNEVIKPLIIKVVERAVATDPRRHKGVATYWNVHGTKLMATARDFWDPIVDADLRRRAEIWVIRHDFDCEDHFGELPRYVMTVEELQQFRAADKPCHRLDWLVDRFTQLGWTEEQIRQEFVEWIENHAEQGLPWEWYVSVAGAKCFPAWGTDRAESALSRRLVHSWKDLVGEYCNRMTLAGFKELGRLGMYDCKKSSFFQAELINLLACGKVGVVVKVLHELGREIGLCKWSDYDTTDKVRKAIEAVLKSMASAAFDKAVEDGHFGIAAALGQHFDCVDESLLRLQANRNFRTQLEAAIDLSRVSDCPKNPEEFWDSVLDGEMRTERDDATCTWEVHIERILRWWIGSLTEEQKTALSQLQAGRDTLFAELIRLRKLRISEMVQTAMDIEQPIALDPITLIR